MTRSVRIAIVGATLLFVGVFGNAVRSASLTPEVGSAFGQNRPAAKPVDPGSGERIFRFDTFGDQQLWTRVLRMHEAIQSVSPMTALQVGLKVDADALPPELIAAIQADQIDLTNAAITIALLQLTR